MNGLKITVHKTTYAFVNLAIKNALEFNMAFTDADIKSVEDVIAEVNGLFDQIINAITIGFTYYII